MPKLPSVSGKDAVKALSKVGFEFRRQAGSQMIPGDYVSKRKKIPSDED